MSDDCVFCKIANQKVEAHIIYESHLVVCFLDLEPINEGHILIVPKIHYSDVDKLHDEVIIEIMLVSKRILKALKKTYEFPGYSIMQNGGEFCDFGHYHMHIFPRFHGDGFGWQFGNCNLQAYNKNVAAKIKEGLV